MSLSRAIPPFGAALRFVFVGQVLRVSPCGGLPLLRILWKRTLRREQHCPRCVEAAIRIVCGIPDPEDLERAGIDYELGGLMVLEESSE